MALLLWVNGRWWNRREKSLVWHYIKTNKSFPPFQRICFTLDRLDGITKRKSLDKPASMEDWLQSGLPDDYDQRKKCAEGKKRVLIIFALLPSSLSVTRWNDLAGSLGRRWRTSTTEENKGPGIRRRSNGLESHDRPFKWRIGSYKNEVYLTDWSESNKETRRQLAFKFVILTS